MDSISTKLLNHFPFLLDTFLEPINDIMNESLINVKKIAYGNKEHITD